MAFPSRGVGRSGEWGGVTALWWWHPDLLRSLSCQPETSQWPHLYQLMQYVVVVCILFQLIINCNYWYKNYKLSRSLLICFCSYELIHALNYTVVGDKENNATDWTHIRHIYCKMHDKHLLYYIVYKLNTI